MKVFTSFLAALSAGLTFLTVEATDIDSGFTQDGSTTYCMGVATGGTPGALSFDTLYASNAGRCPVGVTITPDASEYHVSDLITVKWAAAVNKGVSSSIFPNAIDDTTGLPGAVTSSSMTACTSGTNCGTIVDGTQTGADGTSSGSFATDETMALETNTFTLTTEGDYILLGLVVLPGDDSLNVTAEEYVAFKKITVVSADTVISSTSGSSSTGSSGWGSTSTSMSTLGSLQESTSLSSSGDVLSSTDGENESNVITDSKSTTSPSTATDSTTAPDTSSSSAASTSTSSSGSSFFSTSGVIIIAAVVGCCVVAVVGFAFVMRRRKERRMAANKAFDLNSPSMSSDMDDSTLDGHHGGGKIDLTYVANISARNTDKSARNIMSDESSVAIMASAERGSELNASSNGSSLRSPQDMPLDDEEELDYPQKVSYGASGAAGSANSSGPQSEAYRISNMSELSSLASGSQSEVSMSNFGDSVVDESQQHYLHSGDWKNSEYSRESSRMDSRLDSEEHEELKARGFGSIGGFSTVSGFSEENASRITGFSEEASSRGTAFSMSSRPTEDSRGTDFSEALRSSRLNSEVSVDSYNFRPSRSSADSYSSGMSPYSREGSRISGMSTDSNADSFKH
ncbi:hypothetical protein BBJ28_00010324 [Nothophytophthora sp. Chile5]|nr:hypothetical protein BBJ28_00010324 [Nothophytophthora sp. Chile5]